MLLHKDIESDKSRCDNMENLKIFSEEVTIGKKKVRITLEFPYEADPKDADRFEHMLKEIYLNRFQTVSFQTPRGNVKQVCKEK